MEDRALAGAPPAATRVPLAAGVCINKLLALLAWRERALGAQLAGEMAAAARAAGGQKQAEAAAQKVRPTRCRPRRPGGGAARCAAAAAASAAGSAAAADARLCARPAAQAFDENLDRAVALGWANVDKSCAATFHARAQAAAPALQPALALLAKLYAASRCAPRGAWASQRAAHCAAAPRPQLPRPAAGTARRTPGRPAALTATPASAAGWSATWPRSWRRAC
jgi:hypothetical protein